MPLFRGLITPLVRAFILGVYLYTPRPIAGLVGLYRGIAEGLPLSLWLSSIGGGLAPCPGSIEVYFIDSGGTGGDSLPPWAYPRRGTAKRRKLRREWLELPKNLKRLLVGGKLGKFFTRFY